MLPECQYFIEQNLENSTSIFGMDGTFGQGGHSFAFLERFKNLNMISFDQDPQAIQNGQNEIKKKSLSNRIELIHDNYVNFSNYLKNRKLDFILLDLGVSSHQFDAQERGFSFRKDAPLDMRMDCGYFNSNSAFNIINEYDEVELADILWEYGEEKFSRRIAKAIVEKRKVAPIETTGELEQIIFSCYPKNLKHGRLHPATKSFQAIRIATNDELGVLEKTLELSYQHLSDKALLLIISFHSLEDRIVKHFMKNTSQLYASECKILTKKPILPSEEEININSRSRSAKLRILLKDPHGGGDVKKKKYQNKQR
jgi:16S rRNA (cytosine1402-N4)-methyltransferase